MNLKEQEYVCALAENGTITAAAKELFISQPALSIYINNLEKSGCPAQLDPDADASAVISSNILQFFLNGI